MPAGACNSPLCRCATMAPETHESCFERFGAALPHAHSCAAAANDHTHATSERKPLEPAARPIDDDELRLFMASGIGPVLHSRLMATFGTAAAVIGARADQ